MLRTLIFLFVGLVFGELVTWGDPLCKPESTAAVEFPNLRDVVSIASTTFEEDDYRDGMFAALKKDGTVVVWGSYPRMHPSVEVYAKLVNVVSITSNANAMAALKSDGTIVTWGDDNYNNNGGNSDEVQSQLVNVASIVANNAAFAALKSDGSVVCWGGRRHGGRDDDGFGVGTMAVCVRQNQSDYRQYVSVQSDLVNVVSITAIQPAGFVALKNDGTLVLWGGGRWLGVWPSTSDATNVASVWPSASSSFRGKGSIPIVVIKTDGTAVSIPTSNRPSYFTALDGSTVTR